MRDIRARWRRFSMGVSTLLGRPRGMFAPYRYAGAIALSRGYPELERAFTAAEDRIAALLDAVDGYAERLAQFEGPPPEPRWDQSWFPRLDGAAAYAVVRQYRPRRIVEVGSGHSTRILARAATDAWCEPEITCIDPAPRAGLDGLGIAWRQRMLGAGDLDRFLTLDAGDIAFFDSSHLLWPGTDTDLILNRILPGLRAGVLVHLHDILLPDPYPAEWAWRGYTEQLGLGGWLMGGACRLLFASHYALTRMGAAERPGIAGLPLPPGARETSLWLERL